VRSVDTSNICACPVGPSTALDTADHEILLSILEKIVFQWSSVSHICRRPVDCSVLQGYLLGFTLCEDVVECSMALT